MDIAFNEGVVTVVEAMVWLTLITLLGGQSDDALPLPPMQSPRKSLEAEDPPAPHRLDRVAVPDRPRTVAEFSRPAKRMLSLEDALLVALRNNRTLKVARFTPQIARTQVTVAESFFDPWYEVGAGWGVRDTQLASSIDVAGTNSDFQRVETFGASAGQPVQLGIGKRLLSGGTVRADWQAGYMRQSPVGDFAAVNPAWNTATIFSLEQPLFRGRGMDVNQAPILVAQSGYRQSEYEFQLALMSLVRDVELAYWDFALSSQLLEVSRQATDQAFDTLSNELEKMKLGESSRPAIAQAREHYERTRIVFISQKNALLRAERSFRQVLGIPGFDQTELELQADQQRPAVDADWERAVLRLKSERPDYRAQMLAADIAWHEYLIAKNQTRPDLNLVGSYTLPGLDQRFSNSFDKMLTDGTYDWNLGIQYRRPVRNRLLESEARRAELQYGMQRARLDELEYGLLHELQQAYQDLISAVETADVHTQLRMASRERLDANTEFFRLGGLAIDFLLRSQVAYSESLAQEKSAMINVRKALVQWAYSQGTLLDNRSIILEDGILEGGISEDGQQPSPLRMPEPVPLGGPNTPGIRRLPPVSSG